MRVCVVIIVDDVYFVITFNVTKWS